MQYKCIQYMQSIPRILQSSLKQLIQPLIDKPNTISVIPQITTPNQILPNQPLLSKPASHLFLHNIDDIQSSSASLQPLYNPQVYTQNDTTQHKLFSLYQEHNQGKFTSPTNKNKFKVNQLHSLRDFFLKQNQNILFISRTVCFALKQNQNILFKKLINTSRQNLTESILAKEHFFQTIKKLLNILSDKQKFPFLCPQLNQTVTEKQSLNNVALQSESDDFLSFDDNFECSNILMARKFGKSVNSAQIYCICTRFDYQTASYGQWFYFSVKRWSDQVAENRKYKFIICNMTKRYSMLGLQMKISVCRNGSWQKQGENIRYYETFFKRGNKLMDVQNLSRQQVQKLSRNHQFYYALEFDLQLGPNEQILVAYNEPYSLSKVSRLLDGFSKVFDSHINKGSTKTCQDTTEFQNQLKSKEFIVNTKSIQPQIFFKRQIVCSTPLKNQVQCVTFSMKKHKVSKNTKTQDKDQFFTVKEDRKIIFIMSRAHPIETAGSFVLDGFMRNLFLFLQYKNDRKRKQQLQNCFQSQNKGALLQNLLDKFVIKIIPMINPDGVVIGNSRCNFFGLDLNRQWKRSNKNQSYEIYSLKRFLLKFKDRIEMVIDLHGHSKERNVFAYGMHDFKNPFSTREFPYILSKITEQNFLFDKCRFTRLSELKPKIDCSDKQQTKENVKQGTARIWLFRKLQIPNIFTIENSYCSSIYSKFHYDSQTYGKIGKQILLGICFYFINYSDQHAGKQRNQKSRKKRGFNQGKSFEEDRVKGEPPSTILTIHDLRSFKDSILFDLQSKEQNATMGIEQINSSQSQEERRIEDEIIQRPMVMVKKEMQSSPNKSKSHHNIKKVYEQKPASPTRINRYPTAIEDDEKPYNFNVKLLKAESPLLQQSSNNKVRDQGNNLKQKSRYMSSGVQRLRDFSSGKRSPSSLKSAVDLQKNVTLSIVQLGFQNAKLMDMHTKSQRKNHESSNNITPSFPHINSGNGMMYPHNYHHNVQLNNRINQKIHQNSISSSQNRQLKIICRKPQESGATTDILQKAQQRRNVSEFMKKIESNRKLQNELVTTKKREKYKEIIMKISGSKP